MNVYAVELSSDVLQDERFRKQNPNHNNTNECILLSTCNVSPERRFEEIKEGTKHVVFAGRYGKKLRPDLIEEFNKNSIDAYEAVECIYKLAIKLRKHGYSVFVPENFLLRCKVYIIKLNDLVLSDLRFNDANPSYKDGMPCVYVGMTTKEPEDRFKDHKNGNHSNRFVYEYGEKLLKKLYKKHNENFMYSWEASRLEKSLALELRDQGYGVWQN